MDELKGIKTRIVRDFVKINWYYNKDADNPDFLAYSINSPENLATNPDLQHGRKETYDFMGQFADSIASDFARRPSHGFRPKGAEFDRRTVSQIGSSIAGQTNSRPVQSAYFNALFRIAKSIRSGIKLDAQSLGTMGCAVFMQLDRQQTFEGILTPRRRSVGSGSGFDSFG